MPLYDRACAAKHECQWSKTDCYEPINAPDPGCPQCGGPTARVWSSGFRRVGAIADSIPGGLKIENMGHEPVTVYSMTEFKRECEKRGLVNVVKHVGRDHGDKSKITARWT